MNTYNRLPHILNRNIDPKHKITKEQINSAFSKKEYSLLDDNEKYIFSKFIKEVEIEDIDIILENYNFSKDDIKRIYKASHFRESSLSKEWDKYFGIKSKQKHTAVNAKHQTSAVNNILCQRNLEKQMTVKTVNRIIKGLTETLDIYIQEINEGKEKEDPKKLKGFMKEIDRYRNLLKNKDSKTIR